MTDRGSDYAGRSVLVAGARAAGAAAARVLVDRGARVSVTDRVSPAGAADLPALGVRMWDDAPPAASGVLDGIDQVVTSPGFPPGHPLFAAAGARGIEVIGDVELAWRLRRTDAPWIGVTGTNGKTTTVRMLTAILRSAGLDAVAAGNVGTPLVDVVTAEAGPDVVVAELSSFQLHWTSTVRCAVGTVLNVAADHLDWHGSFEAYAADKGRILARDTVAVVNAEDAWSVRLAAGRAEVVRFGTAEPAPGDFGVRGRELVEAGSVGGSGPVVLAAVGDVGVPGPHNLANAVAAAALARTAARRCDLAVGPADVRAGLRAFVPDPHRNALVGVASGVSYVDDSKATNPHAAAASLAAYRRVVWIAGGLLKGADTDELAAAAAGRLAGVVLLGRDRAVIAASIARHAPEIPVVQVDRTDDGAMSDVVSAAAAMAAPGDTVLLAPAGASMDMFTDYHARGEAFAAAARALGAA